MTGRIPQRSAVTHPLRHHHPQTQNLRVEVADFPFLSQRPLEARTFTLGKVKTKAHRVGNRQDVRKQNRRIERKSR